MFDLYEGALRVDELYARYFKEFKDKNLGAFLSFCGIVRFEDEVEALSFDIYEALLKSWFDAWQERLSKEHIKLCFAHSVGEVRVHESSFFVALFSKQRKAGLRYLNEFVEDFKKNAPIWKYDVKNGEKIYAKARSKKLANAGILA